MIRGIEHTAIASPDPAKLAQWYVNALGFTINYQSANAVFVKAPDGSMIEFIRAEGERVPRTQKSPGIRHLALAVDGFDEIYKGLLKKGVAFIDDPVEKNGNKVVFFTDPEGNYLHLLQRQTPLP
jgi:glyoxylase I family protein